MNAVTLFALAIFTVSWFFHRRLPEHDTAARLFCRAGMGTAIAIWLLGLIVRVTT